MAQYSPGDDGDSSEEIVAPIEERVKALLSTIEETERHLRGLGFEPNRLIGARGFIKIEAIAEGVEAVYTPDEALESATCWTAGDVMPTELATRPERLSVTLTWTTTRR